MIREDLDCLLLINHLYMQLPAINYYYPSMHAHRVVPVVVQHIAFRVEMHDEPVDRSKPLGLTDA